MTITLDEPDRSNEPNWDWSGRWVCLGQCLTGQFYLDRREDSYMLLWTPWKHGEMARQFLVSPTLQPLLDSIAAVEALRKPRRQFTRYNTRCRFDDEWRKPHEICELPQGEYGITRNSYVWWYDLEEADIQVKPRLPAELAGLKLAPVKKAIPRARLKPRIPKAILRKPIGKIDKTRKAPPARGRVVMEGK